MRLGELLEAGEAPLGGSGDVAGTTIAGLTADSRKVEAGFLFAALPGERADGTRFIGDAVARGAAAVLMRAGATLPSSLVGAAGSIPVILAANPRRRFAQMAARFFQRQPRVTAAVTGTNGKTSVVWFLRQIWAALGQRAAALGTLGLVTAEEHLGGSLTTPDPVALHRTVAGLAARGIEHLAIEASSHGLDQYRLDGLRIAAAGFTNLSRDHLDYHRSTDAYLQAKLRLFSELVAGDGAAVVNADAEHAPAVSTAAGRLRCISYGRQGRELRLDDRAALPDGQRLELTVDGARLSVRLPLVGDFQASNALCAAGLAWATGSDPRAAVMALESLQPVPGRLQRVGRRANGAAVFVDYAHTPDALATVLTALRPSVGGRLVVVFGCGGDRDAGKRPEMGRIAATLADRVVVTDDNPRSEEPAAIRRQILAASVGAIEIGDRRAAIRAAIDGLAAGDVLVIAGKGHETGQTVGTEVFPFDDCQVARDALREIDG